MYDINTITAPAELLSLSEVKGHLKIDHTDEDGLLSALIKAARVSLEKYCAISIGEQEKEWIADMDGCEEIPYGPILEVSKVEYKTDIDTYDDYTLEGKHDIDGKGFKTFEPFITGRWCVTYTAGYTALPEDLKQALLHQVAHLYQNRGESKVSDTAKLLANPYRRVLA